MCLEALTQFVNDSVFSVLLCKYFPTETEKFVNLYMCVRSFLEKIDSFNKGVRKGCCECCVEFLVSIRRATIKQNKSNNTIICFVNNYHNSSAMDNLKCSWYIVTSQYPGKVNSKLIYLLVQYLYLN